MRTVPVLKPRVVCAIKPFFSTAFLVLLTLVISSRAHASNDEFLYTLGKDTWNYLKSDWATTNHLPWSWRSATLSGGDYCNPAEIGLLALSYIAAYHLQKTWSPAWTEVETEVGAILDQLRAWQTGSQAQGINGPNAYNNSVFYQWYWINWNPPVVGNNAGTNHVVPSIDNAWLATCLIVIREYCEANGHPSLSQKASDILNDMDFTLWYDTDLHLFYWGGVESPKSNGVCDIYSNENRIINFVARALGHLSNEEFALSIDALQKPAGIYGDITVEKVAWDGSIFTYLAPALFIREMHTGYGLKTIVPAIQAQIDYASDNSYYSWGISDCFGYEDSDYMQQGSLPKAPGNTDLVETVPGLVSPHASALALISSLFSDAVSNLVAMKNEFPDSYDLSFGFRDSVMAKANDPKYGVPSNRFSALAQQWIFLAGVNDKTGFIWDYFYRDEGVVRAHNELFLIGDIDGNGLVELSDVILLLQVLIGTNSSVDILKDVGVKGNGQLGSSEVIHILQVISNLR